MEELGKDLMLAIHGYVNANIKLEPVQIQEPVDRKKMYYNNAGQAREEDNSD